VLLYDREKGLFHWNAGRLQPVALPEQVRASPILALFTERNGRIWAAFDNGHIAWIHCRAECQFGELTEDLEGGRYKAIYEDAAGTIWLGGSDGVTRYSDGQFDTVSKSIAPRLANVSAIVEDRLGYLWVGTGYGLVKLRKSEFDASVKDHQSTPRHSFYSRTDGLAGSVGYASSVVEASDNRRAVQDHLGRLWFATNRGVTLVNPQLLDQTYVNAPVYIASLTVDGPTEFISVEPMIRD